MGGALIRAACRAVGPDQVVIADYLYEKAQALEEELGCTAARTNGEAAGAASYVFLCVKPQVLPEVARALAPGLTAGQAVVSIAAGIRTDAIRAWVGQEVPVLRVMPNTCAAIGQGMLALTAAPGVAEVHFGAVEEILSRAGRVERISEGLMDQFTAVAGCGPAYVYQFIEALADGGVMTGLPRREAQIYAPDRAGGGGDGAGERRTPRRAEGCGVLTRRLHHRGCGKAGGARIPLCRGAVHRRRL